MAAATPQLPSAPDLAALTGVRSSKHSYYPEYRRSDERMQRAVRAMDSISRALVRTVEGPRGLLVEVVRAAAEHLQAPWTLLGLSDGVLPTARPRLVAIGPDGAVLDDEHELDAELRRELGALRAGVWGRQPVDHRAWVRVPMTLDGTVVGGIIGRHGLSADPEAADLSVLRILANQAAVSLHTSQEYQASLTLRRRAQQLYDEATQQAHDLLARDAELRQAEHRLVLARQRALIDSERHRIARELHDSVAQLVLSAGMSVDVARHEAADLGGGDELLERLDGAKELTRRAVEQLRSVIYALHHQGIDEQDVSALPELLAEVAGQHEQHLPVGLRVEGQPFALGIATDHALARIAGEALFNAAVHARATRAVVRLRYAPNLVRLWVADDGDGDPVRLRALLRLQSAGDSDGRHRGLVNMADRATELGGTLSLRRANLGGVRVEVTLPWPLAPSTGEPA